MDTAASLIEKAIIANPTYAEAYNNLGLSFSICVSSVCLTILFLNSFHLHHLMDNVHDLVKFIFICM
jgi:hypothetical protein